MPEEHAKSFGGGSVETSLNPIVLIAMVVAVLLILTLPKRRILLPLLMIIFLVPIGQAVVIGSLHFFVSRIILLAGLARLAASKSRSGSTLAGGFNTIDRAFLWCMICQAAATVILFASGPSLIYESGFLLDFLGTYFILRWLIASEADLYLALKCFALLSLVLAAGMVMEQVKLVNVFSFIGGGQISPELRDGKIRSQAVFQHPLLAGYFAATLLPLFVLLWRSGEKTFAAMGVFGVTAMTVASNSSTPLLAYVGGLVAICLWPLRGNMRNLRRGIVCSLIALHLIMKAPVWFLIAHVDLTGSSSGYHRAELVDQFIRHFSDWWLIGVKDTSTWGWDLWDSQNQFVSIGEGGGLLAFVFFIALLARSFARIGTARKTVEGDRRQEWRLWLLGAALFSHIVAFFGVNYFDQSKVGFFVLLAMISAITAPASVRPERSLGAEDLNRDTGLSEFHPALAEVLR